MFDEAKIRLNAPVKYDREYEIWGRFYPREYFGRTEQLETLLSHLRNSEDTRPIAIIGERRSGKTSMLLHIELWAQKKDSRC